MIEACSVYGQFDVVQFTSQVHTIIIQENNSYYVEQAKQCQQQT